MKLSAEQNIIAFKKFLVKKGVMDEYMENLLANNWESFDNFMYHNRNSTLNYLGCAFGWRASPQGYAFWNKLCNEWNYLVMHPKLELNKNITTL